MPAAFAHLHADAAAALGRWTAPSEATEQIAARMRAVLQTDSTAMWREHSGVHFTASTYVLNPELTQVALTLHGKAKRWFQFGGHFEAADASLDAAALREAREESQLEELHLLGSLLTVDAHELPGAFGRCREHLDLRFVAIAPHPAQLDASDESDAVAWWDVTAMPADAEDTLLDGLRLALERARSSGYGSGPLPVVARLS